MISLLMQTIQSRIPVLLFSDIRRKHTHILACKFICVNFKCRRMSKFLKFKIFNELDRFFSSFQVPVNESARQVCRYLTRTARSVSFGRVRLRSETFERARPLCRLLAGQGGSLEDYTLHPQRRTFTDSIIFQHNCLLVCFILIVLLFYCVPQFPSLTR